MIRINPALEALGFGQTLAVFAGDRTLSFQGQNNLDFLRRLKSAFVEPRSENELKTLDPLIFGMLPELIIKNILIKDIQHGAIEFHSSSRIESALREFINLAAGAINQEASILVSIPDCKGLSVQKKALSELKLGQFLLAGIYRSTSVFILPLISNSKLDLTDLFFRLLSTELGIGNAYLTEELYEDTGPAPKQSGVEKSVAQWIASDLFALMKNGMLNDQVARIYRGSFVKREDISFQGVTIPVDHQSTIEEKVDALAEMFVGSGKVIARYNDFSLGDARAPIYAVTADMARPRMLCEQESEDINSWGTGESQSSARLAAFMEAIERYTTGSYLLDDHPLRSQKSLDHPVLDRMAVTGYGPSDRYAQDLASETPRRWHSVKSIASNSEYFVPLELIRYPVFARELGYQFVDETNSSGVAAHFSRDLAIRAACYELVERDAFLIAWLRKASPPLIDLNSVPEGVKRKIGVAMREGWDIRMVNLTSDLAPVICVLLRRNTPSCCYAIGAASRDNPEEACLKALHEAVLTLGLSKSFSQQAPETPENMIKNLKAPVDHWKLYGSGNFNGALMKPFASANSQQFSQIAHFPFDVVSRIIGSGMNLYIADLVGKNVKAMAPAIAVVRVLIPGLVPMYFGRHWVRTGSVRIHTIPEQLGWPTEAKEDSEYQRFPHPFH
jgi:thiazole/oxazole-forming peptide maturase SagD family component